LKLCDLSRWVQKIPPGNPAGLRSVTAEHATSQHERKADEDRKRKLEKEEAEEIELLGISRAANLKKSEGRKRGKYLSLDSEARIEIGGYAAVHGPQAAVHKFSYLRDGRGLALSTAYGLQDEYLKRINNAYTPKKHGGSKPRYGEVVDNKLLTLINGLREAGAPIHISTIQCAIKALMLLNDVGHLLGGDDGQFKASKTWAFEWLHRHNLSSRVATKAVPGKVPSVEVTRDFQHRIALAQCMITEYLQTCASTLIKPRATSYLCQITRMLRRARSKWQFGLLVTNAI